MRLISRTTPRWLYVLVTAALCVILGTGTASAAIPVGQPFTGSMTWYNDVGYGACGTSIDASTQSLVAVSYAWWTTANPNADPLCQGISVQVTYNGKTLTVPVEDKCPSCDPYHIDLSEPVFAQFAPLGTGNVQGITWQFVGSGGTGGGPSPLPAPGGLSVSGTTASSVSLGWNAVSGAASYNVYRNGGKVGSTGSTSYTDSGLASATGYSYTVAAVDSSGVVGTQSAAVTATTGGGGTGGGTCATPWSSSTSYVPGNVVSYNGHNWKATYYSTGAVPGDPTSWAVWQDSGPC